MTKTRTNNRELRHIVAHEFRAATAADGTRTITGYAALFNAPSVDLGGWVEIISPGAFARSLSQNPDVLCLYNHNSDAVLGRTSSGTLTLETDGTGLKFTCSLPDTQAARDLTVLIERGDVSGCSFGFVTEQASWSALEDGRDLRTLLDVTLYEVTITSDPAYTDTSVALRSAPHEVRSRILAEDVETQQPEQTESVIVPETYFADAERLLAIADLIAS